MKLKYVNINGFGVLVDESAEINPRDYMIHSVHQNKVKRAKFDGVENKWVDWWKIIFAEKELNLDVPILPNWREFELKQIALKELQDLSKKHFLSIGTLSTWGDGFIAGYNHNKAEYTLNDLKEAFEQGYGFADEKLISRKEDEECEYTFENLIQSLQKYPEYIVMEYYRYKEFSDGENNYQIDELRPKLITNSEGKQQGIIKELIY